MSRPQHLAASLPPGGVYIALFRLARPRRIRVGRLGTIAFPAGIYAYVGSAQRNLPSRLRRHARRRKPLRWHIDYLSSRARMLGAIVLNGPKSMECRLARSMANVATKAIPAFGSSDCRCRSHLFRL